MNPIENAVRPLKEDAMANAEKYARMVIGQVERGLTVRIAQPTGVLVERWKTQTIVNTSKLGKVFNQFPTRRVK
jgi:hypothetical protein